MFKTKILTALAKAGVAAKGFAILHAPAALVAVGAGLVIWAIVETAKAASKPNDELEQAVGDLEEAHDMIAEGPEEDRKEWRKKKGKAFRKVIREFIRQYKKPCIIATLGLSCMVGGYFWVAKRFALAAAEAAAASATIATLDRNIRNTFGDDIANAMYSEEFDPEELDKHMSRRAVEAAAAAGTLQADDKTSADYAKLLIGDEDDPEHNLYHWNKNVTEDKDYYSTFDGRIIWLRCAVASMQSDLDNRPECMYFSREYVLKRLGLIGATMHIDDEKGHKEADDDEQRGWCKGDTIDIGITDILNDFAKPTKDVEAYRKYLEEKWGNDLILHFNCTYDARNRAKFISPSRLKRQFIGLVPKKWQTMQGAMA